mmetsp:Transcript_55907/g.107907  ORF Transcript_55907/g.107907 Transcript_55907/m.107907 type:complete len:109 (-) Transcript_55907:796-1122(-)
MLPNNFDGGEHLAEAMLQSVPLLAIFLVAVSNQCQEPSGPRSARQEWSVAQLASVVRSPWRRPVMLMPPAALLLHSKLHFGPKDAPLAANWRAHGSLGLAVASNGTSG